MFNFIEEYLDNLVEQNGTLELDILELDRDNLVKLNRVIKQELKKRNFIVKNENYKNNYMFFANNVSYITVTKRKTYLIIESTLFDNNYKY